MEIANQIDLPITYEEFEGLHGMWRAGADYEEMAKALGMAPMVLGWCLMMKRSIRSDSRVRFKESK